MNFKCCVIVLFAAMAVVSCKLPFGETSIRDTEKNTLSLKFHPQPGTSYHYAVENKTSFSLEMNSKKVEKSSELTAAVNYLITQDSSGNYLFVTHYDKLHLVSKNDDVETVSDAENAAFSINGTDRMLGALKDSKLVVSVGPGRETKIVSGYEELSKRLLSSLDTTNVYARQVAQQKIDQIIKEGLIKKNIDQLFQLFPDSAIRIGSRWKINTTQQEDFPLHVNSSYTLNDIDDGTAFIASRSTIASDKTPLATLGTAVVADLSGEQEGVYQVETSTCMLLNASITSSVEGRLDMGGTSIPVSIKLTVNVKGKKS